VPPPAKISLMAKAIKTRAIIFLFLVIICIYFAGSPGDTPYNYFTRLADAFLAGRLTLTQNPPWLSELITISTGKYTFVNPPLPAILLVPLVAVFGIDFPQQWLAHFLGAGATVLTFKLALYITKSSSKALWVSLALGLGSVVWFLSSVGSVWYLGQVTALFFVLSSLNFLYAKKPNVLMSGFMFALSCLARTQLFLAAPFFVLMILAKSKSISLKNVAFAAMPTALAVGVFGLYNWARFGSFTQTGYPLIPNLLNEPWFHKGVFSLSYIPNHLKVILTSLPVFKPEFPYIFPTVWGLAIWITSPVFIYALFASIREKIVKIAWGAIAVIALVNFSFGSTGFSQFGYRYAVDFYPFLILLLCLYLKNRQLTKLHWLLLTISILVNAWGVVFINKLGFVV